MIEANHAVVLNRYARGERIDEQQFSVVTQALPDVADGQILLRTITLSVDPYLRSCMTGVDNFFLPQFELGRPLYSGGVAEVVESKLDGFAPGNVVVGTIDWSDYSVWSASDRMVGGGAVLQHLDPHIDKLSHALGAVGLNGITAFFGVLAVARPRRGETVVVSGAAGGVGSIAGQIAKIQGARVIGLAGTTDKRAVLVDELGFDAALDYRSERLADDLLALVPGGPDIYFDNVGGDLSQTVMWTMRHPARVIECGQISTYDEEDGGWRVDIRPIHGGSLRFESFTPVPFLEYEPAARAQLAHWIRQGKVIALETEHEGLASAPRALVDLFRGGNIGKAVVSVSAARRT